MYTDFWVKVQQSGQYTVDYTLIKPTPNVKGRVKAASCNYTSIKKIVYSKIFHYVQVICYYL